MTLRTRSILILGGVAITLSLVAAMWVRHRHEQSALTAFDTQQTAAPPLRFVELERAVRSEVRPDITVARFDEFVVLRGSVDSAASALRAEEIARAHGARRVINALRIRANRDEEIRRSAERELARDRSFDDCEFSVACDRGVVRVKGRVRTDLQTDAVRAALRRVPGVERVETDLRVF